MLRQRQLIGCVLAVVMVLAGPLRGDIRAFDRVTFVPHWLPQAQFAGYYVAQDKGFYKKNGLEVTLVTGGPRVSSVHWLEEGKADFVSMWLTKGIQRRSVGVPIINLAQLINQSALMLIAKKSGNIHTPQDMNGRKVGLWGDDFLIQPLAFFEKYNLNVIPVQQNATINLFFQDGIDVTTAMWYNEYHTILNSGFNEDELVTFFFKDHGLNFPEDGIYCREEFYRKNESLCRAFVSATLEGWQYARQQPEEALDIVIGYIKQAKLGYNKAHQRWMLHRMLDLIFSEGKTDRFERLSPEGYQLVAGQMKTAGLIKMVPDYRDFYKPIQTRESK